VHVQDLLTPVSPDVRHEPIAAFINARFSGNFLDEAGHLPHRLGIDFIETDDMTLGNDEYMHGRYGCDIVKGHKPLIFQNDAFRSPVRGYLAEDTHDSSSFPSIVNFNLSASFRIAEGMDDTPQCSNRSR